MTILKNSSSHTYAKMRRARIDLSLSENPLGPSLKAIDAIIDNAGKSHIYPCDQEEALITLIAQHHQITKDRILLGAGVNEILEDYLKAFALNKSIVAPSATFPESIACMSSLNGSVKRVSLQANFRLDLGKMLKACTKDTGLIHLCNPNNPTGIWTECNQLSKLAEQSPVPLLISEAGADFVKKSIIHQSMDPNIIVARSFSKAYGLAGLRIGYSVASPAIIATMKSKLRSYRVSSLAIAAAVAAMQDQEHLQNSIAYVLREKDWLMSQMQNVGFHVVSSHGQTFIAKVPPQFGHANNFCALAEQYEVAVVNCSLYPELGQYIRLSPQKRSINKKFILILKKMQEGK